VARPAPDTDDRAARKQIELLRAADPARRLARARSLSASVIGLSRQAIRNRHPGASERDVLLRFVEVHYGKHLADQVRSYLAKRGR
jgi:hypothetical protein